MPVGVPIIIPPFEPAPPVPSAVVDRVEALGRSVESLASEQRALAELVSPGGVAEAAPVMARLEIFQGYLIVGVIAFVITLLTTPIVRRLAISNGIVDHPDERKIHRMPIAYLGGVSVFLGILGAIFYSYVAASPFGEGLIDFHPTSYMHSEADAPMPVPPWVLLGITVIMLVGLLDDVTGIPPRVKLGGQLFAAAALAYGDIGVNVARGVLSPTIGKLVGNQDLQWILELPMALPLLGTHLEIDLIYWSGAAVIAVFVLGACNASNLIDGLDGLLSGTTAIAAIGLLVIALGLAVEDHGRLDSARIILCLALAGACLGFLPHNFNPANIFLGDCGSLMLGFCTIVIILSLGDAGMTFLVLAGLIIYALPIIDTLLAIVRRKLAGKRMSDPDSDHLHHMLKRALGVKGAVLTLYVVAAGFAVLGVMLSETRARVIYAITLVLVSYITVYAIKIARRAQFEQQSAGLAGGPGSQNARPGAPEHADTAGADPVTSASS